MKSLFADTISDERFSPPSSSSQSTLRLFITGGSGYIGRNLIRYYVARGVEVIALARSAKAREAVRVLGACPFDGDLFSEHLAAGMWGCDALIHAASDTSHGLGSETQWETNVEGTRRVFEAARVAGIARAVLVSTASVLFDGRPLVNATENHPYPGDPAGLYSRSKAEAERVALASAAPGFAVTAVRPRFVWGRDDSTTLPQFLRAAESGQFAWIGGGRFLTSTTHIANLVHGVALAHARGSSGEAYFITDRDPVEFREFLTALLATQGVAAPEREIPRWMARSAALIGRSMAVLSRGRIVPSVTSQKLAASTVEVTLDIRKARQQLGYVPIISREFGLAEMRLSARQLGLAGVFHTPDPSR